MYVAVHVINPSPYLDKTTPGTQWRADNTVIGGQGGPGQPSNRANEQYPSPKPAGPFSQEGCVRNQNPSLASVWVLLRGRRPPRCPVLPAPTCPSWSPPRLPALHPSSYLHRDHSPLPWAPLLDIYFKNIIPLVPAPYHFIAYPR